MGTKHSKCDCVWTPPYSGRIVEEPEKVVEICTNLCKKFTDNKAYVEHELKHSGPAVLCLELEPEHMTGKLVNES